MKTDAQLLADVSQELLWDPSVNASHVEVSARDGVVSLSGQVDSCAASHAVERAVQRVEGVKAVVGTLRVELAPGHRRSDADIAAACAATFRWSVEFPGSRVRVKVVKGWVSLEGELDWEYQRHSAEKAVRGLVGVVGISNGIGLRPVVTPANISHRIRDALARHAERAAGHVEVTVAGSTVTLRGWVDSWAERRAAQCSAWSAPGISLVVNELAVGRVSRTNTGP